FPFLQKTTNRLPKDHHDITAFGCDPVAGKCNCARQLVGFLIESMALASTFSVEDAALEGSGILMRGTVAL
ncbi:MAG: hypothetical protein R3245_04270, partial [Kiloniellales bacterium]|nr:hypothetical protein [Kiloniellales bacterium]